ADRSNDRRSPCRARERARRAPFAPRRARVRRLRRPGLRRQLRRLEPGDRRARRSRGPGQHASGDLAGGRARAVEDRRGQLRQVRAVRERDQQRPARGHAVVEVLHRLCVGSL
ncbi:MAG: hypothetical protein AVDCRST_MAG50-452, partial [uncultured Acidimicrobiales bacterium]